MKAATHVYFVEAVGLERIKIGKSRRPVARLRELAAVVPVHTSLLACVTGISEERVHSMFAKWRLHGEWFQAHASLRLFVRSLPRRGRVSDQRLRRAVSKSARLS